MTQVSKSLRVLVAPGGFKESLGSSELASAIARGVRRVLPDAQLDVLPLTDGGEGFTEALVDATLGTMHRLEVTGPVGQRVAAHYGILGDGETAVLEMASAAGLRLVPSDGRNPLLTTTRGVGELIAAALEHPVKRLLIGCGDSGTNDGGVGMARALGVRFLDASGAELPEGGGALERLTHMDASGLHPRLRDVEVIAACNIKNVLLGERGVARVFGPQKGATPEQVKRLECGLTMYAGRLLERFGTWFGDLPGSGASGGLGTGLMAFLNAELQPWARVVGRFVDLEARLRNADLVITAEGRVDATTATGKVPLWVAQHAARAGVPVLALGGSLGDGCEALHDLGVSWIGSIMPRPASLEEAFQHAAQWAENAAMQAVRLVTVGQRLGAPIPSSLFSGEQARATSFSPARP
jgi:glycerate kinase